MMTHLLPFILCLFCFTACVCPQHYEFSDNPPPLPACSLPEKTRVALVLGGGGARGIAHVGVIEELEKAGIPFDIIIGCSAGAIVGAMYADSLDIDYVKYLLEPMRCEEMLDISLWNGRYGLSQGSAMLQILDKFLEANYFEELKMPFMCVATDLWTGQLVTLGGGELLKAVQASAAIPLVYVPINLHGRVFVDGGVVDPVPVRVAKSLEADYIIAVDLRGNLDRQFPADLFDVARRSADITLLWQGESCILDANIIIRPMLGPDISTFCDTQHEVIYQAGRESALLAIPLIKKHLAILDIPLNSACTGCIKCQMPIEEHPLAEKGPVE